MRCCIVNCLWTVLLRIVSCCFGKKYKRDNVRPQKTQTPRADDTRNVDTAEHANVFNSHDRRESPELGDSREQPSAQVSERRRLFLGVVQTQATGERNMTQLMHLRSALHRHNVISQDYEDLSGRSFISQSDLPNPVSSVYTYQTNMKGTDGNGHKPIPRSLVVSPNPGDVSVDSEQSGHSSNKPPKNKTTYKENTQNRANGQHDIEYSLQ